MKEKNHFQRNFYFPLPLAPPCLVCASFSTQHLALSQMDLMAQGWSWLAEAATAKICRRGPSVAMVTELKLPSGSVRLCHIEPQLSGREPRSLWSLAWPHSSFPVVPIIPPWVLKSIHIINSSLWLNLFQTKGI